MRPGSLVATDQYVLEAILSRREFLRLMSLGGMIPAMSSELSTQEQRSEGKPNILLILVDDLGYGDLSSYGAEDLKSPNVDNLVTSGVKFENFYASTSARVTHRSTVAKDRCTKAASRSRCAPCGPAGSSLVPIAAV